KRAHRRFEPTAHRSDASDSDFRSSDWSVRIAGMRASCQFLSTHSKLPSVVRPRELTLVPLQRNGSLRPSRVSRHDSNYVIDEDSLRTNDGSSRARQTAMSIPGYAQFLKPHAAANSISHKLLGRAVAPYHRVGSRTV